ncbi:glycosyl hydrolase family 28-related protein [Mucilaginibacter sp. HD30]
MRTIVLIVLFCAGISTTQAAHSSNTTITKLKITEVSVLSFGAKGDGISDDSRAIEKALAFCITNNRTCYIPKTTKFYKINSTIRVSINPGQHVKINSNGAVIKPLIIPTNNTAYNLTSFREHIFMSIGKQITSIKDVSMFNFSTKTAVSISGITFDGSDMPIKLESASFNTDIFVGLQILSEDVNIVNCTFKNIFGYGLRVHNLKNAVVANCTFQNVGGRGATPYAQKIDFDGLGDGVYFALVKSNGSIEVKNCTFNGLKFKNIRSRSAVTFEYSTCPYKITLSKLTISGFAKCIHVEEPAPTIITVKKVKMSDFNFGIANVLNNNTKVFFKRCQINVGISDGQDNGDALAFLNYESKAKVYVDSCFLDFNGRKGAYQSAVGLAEVKNSTINGHQTNFFFADGSTIFNKCIFIGFGGKGVSFQGNENSTYTLINCNLKQSQKISALNQKLKLIIK